MFTTIDAVRRQSRLWTLEGARIGFVPTMGNLHEGHMDLFRTIAPSCDRVVCSIFANPLQFGPHEDFAAYPRTLEQDMEKLRSIGADGVFAPSVEEMYGQAGMSETKVSIKRLNNKFCGAHREGHFIGVATVVCKLFNIVMPHVAVFGEKDYQQLAVIRQMVSDLSIPVRILSSPTFREASGLAYSSRNQYLTGAEKHQAAWLFKTLNVVADSIRAGDHHWLALESLGVQQLKEQGFAPDYVQIADADTLELANPDTRRLVILVAARLGKARLIDNLRLDLDPV